MDVARWYELAPQNSFQVNTAENVPPTPTISIYHTLCTETVKELRMI